MQNNRGIKPSEGLIIDANIWGEISVSTKASELNYKLLGIATNTDNNEINISANTSLATGNKV